MFDWLFPKPKYNYLEYKPMWEYSEKPTVDHEAESRETKEIIQEIRVALKEIETLLDEMKNEDDKNV